MKELTKEELYSLDYQQIIDHVKKLNEKYTTTELCQRYDFIENKLIEFLIENKCYYRTCTSCHEHLLYNEFSKDSYKRKNGDFFKKNCKSCTSVYYKNYYDDNQEKITQYHRDENKKNPGRCYEASKKWKQKNKDHIKEYNQLWRSENKEHVREYDREYKKINQIHNRELYIPAWANRREIALLYEQSEKITLKTKIKHHVDHIIPINNKLVCGFHLEDNLQILTASENHQKSNTFYSFCETFENDVVVKIEYFIDDETSIIYNLNKNNEWERI